MLSWRHFWLAKVFLLLICVLNVQSTCYWDSDEATKYCTISCRSGLAEQLSEELERKWNERLNCHADGIHLELGPLSYPNSIVNANWFTARVKVKELTFEVTSILKMEANAFNASGFQSVKKLRFPSMSLNPIVDGLFNGLESLEILNLERAALLKSIEKGALDALSQTLKEFTLEQSSKYFTEISINGFFGSEHLTKLEKVKILYPLNTSISRNTFLGLQSVKILDLSECQITTIGSGAFDPVSSSIIELDLQKNLIKTLPDGLFDQMLGGTVTLGGNQWHCDCDLAPFQAWLMEEQSNFIGEIKCSTPPMYHTYNVISTDFCDTYVPPTKTSTLAISTTTPATSVTPTTPSTAKPLPNEFTQNCFEPGSTNVSKTVTIKTPTEGLRINENENGDVILEVDRYNENSILIWFSTNDRVSYSRESNDLNCLIRAGKTIPIHNLKENSEYIFCSMDSTETTVSPLDCISFTKRFNSDNQAWLFDNSKTLVISMVIVACIVSTFIGLGVGILVLRAKQILENKRYHNNTGIVDSLNQTLQSSVKQRQNRWPSNSTVQYYLENSYNAPPLPKRPTSKNVIEEPAYATVNDFPAWKSVNN